MSTLYQSSKDVPTEVLSARLNQLSLVVSSNRERIDAEFTMRIPAEVDRDADLVMSEAAVRLEALQAECGRLEEHLSVFKGRCAELAEALEKARDAIGSLPQDALGNVPDTQQRQGWHIRDELINDISTALAAYRKGGEK